MAGGNTTQSQIVKVARGCRGADWWYEVVFCLGVCLAAGNVSLAWISISKVLKTKRARSAKNSTKASSAWHGSENIINMEIKREKEGARLMWNKQSVSAFQFIFWLLFCFLLAAELIAHSFKHSNHLETGWFQFVFSPEATRHRRRSNIRSSGGRKSNTKPWNQDSHTTITTSENLTVSY